MAKRVIVADDSLTIQKVVKISLQNADYELIEAKSFAELEAAIANSADLLLYDFGLTGDIKQFESLVSRSPDLPVLIMLGAFDSYEKPDEFSNVVDVIGKPFESQKLISKVESLLSNSAPAPESTDESDDEFGGWGVSTQAEVPETKKSEAEIELGPLPDAAPLESELKGWGMEVPDVIGDEQEEELTELPPIIDEENLAVPSEEDLEYPSEIDLEPPAPEVELEQEVAPEAEEEKSAPQLTPVSDFKEVEEEEVSLSIEPVSAPSGYSLKLEQEIDADINPDEFWAEDGSLEDQEEESSQPEEELEDEFADEVAPIEDELPSTEMRPSVESTEIDPDMVSSIVRETVERMCGEIIEKVAWEIIPDLAENLVKKELKKISEKILDQEK